MAKQHGKLSFLGRVAVITPYSQQSKLLTELFDNAMGHDSSKFVEVNTVDAFQGREGRSPCRKNSFLLICSVRASGSHGIGFLSDVRRMNVALTRAKHFLFVIARCESVVVNPYWDDLVEHARSQSAVAKVPLFFQSRERNSRSTPSFGEMRDWKLEGSKDRKPAVLDNPELSGGIGTKPSDPRKRRRFCASPARSNFEHDFSEPVFVKIILEDVEDESEAWSISFSPSATPENGIVSSDY
eukprot:scaffold10571_cov154-Cylindrotheca_fusiformis.AAC.2